MTYIFILYRKKLIWHFPKTKTITFLPMQTIHRGYMDNFSFKKFC